MSTHRQRGIIGARLFCREDESRRARHGSREPPAERDEVRTGVDTRHGILRNGKAAGKDQPKGSRKNDSCGREQIELQSLGTERGEKAGTHLKPDGVNEQD
jgi:hypothetical protein